MTTTSNHHGGTAMSARPTLEEVTREHDDAQKRRRRSQRKYYAARDVYRLTDEDPDDTTGKALDRAREDYWGRCSDARWARAKMDEVTRWGQQHRIYGSSGVASIVIAAYSPDGRAGQRTTITRYGRAGYAHSQEASRTR